jgi:hypothetical protein
VLVQLTLFVGGVLEETEEELARLLSPFGPILRSVVVTNPAVSGGYVSLWHLSVLRALSFVATSWFERR